MPCIQHTDMCHPSSTPDGGWLLWTGRQGMKCHRSGHQRYRWREGTAARGQAQFPDALILLGSNSACAYRGSHCTAAISPCAAEQGSVGCLAGLFLLHWRAGAAPAPHLDWNGVSGRLWHCHPEPLCKCHNYSKAPLWSLQNSQLKKSILKAAAFK